MCVVSVYLYPRDRSVSFKPSRWGVGNSGSSDRVGPTSPSEVVLGLHRGGSRISKRSLRSELHSVQVSGAGYWCLVVVALDVTVLWLLTCISGPSTTEYRGRVCEGGGCKRPAPLRKDAFYIPNWQTPFGMHVVWDWKNTREEA